MVETWEFSSKKTLPLASFTELIATFRINEVGEKDEEEEKMVDKIFYGFDITTGIFWFMSVNDVTAVNFIVFLRQMLLFNIGVDAAK